MTTGAPTGTPERVSVAPGAAGELLSLHPCSMLVGVEKDLLDTIKTIDSSFLSRGVRKSTKSN